MKHVAKLAIIDNEHNYLMMYRSDHPDFGRDADLPGGTQEPGETTLQTMLREVVEEAGITLTPADVELVYEGTDYSENGTHYSLFLARLSERPAVHMSWEHSAYEWISREAFLDVAHHAKDTYMHMVYDALKVATKV